MPIFTAEDFSSTSARQRRVRAGALKSVARGLWTDEVDRDLGRVVAAHWRQIIGRTMPGAVISDRSAFDPRPVDGKLFVSHARSTPLRLPGLTVYPDGKRANRRDDDIPLDPQGRLFTSSVARALIDNAEARGRPGAVRRKLTREELHDQVVRIVTTYTPRQVETIMATVEQDANGVAAESVRVFVDAARGHVQTLRTSSRAMTAAQRGEQYDYVRVALFRQVAADLQTMPLIDRHVDVPLRYLHVPFYEAYFSNYIEGSTLTIDEAERVVFDNADVGKPEDSHDIRATWEIVADRAEMSRGYRDADDFLDALRDRHRVMMAAHPRANPGEWKSQRNQAGATVFVDPGHVVGTLRAAWEEAQSLTDAFRRATYMMFVVSEVHPFADGNGRSARVAMNAELVAQDMHRIVIPTILRNDYMSALTRATAGNGPRGLHRVLAHAQDWVRRGHFQELSVADRYLRATDALVDSGVADRQGLHLRLLKPGEFEELGDVAFPTDNGAAATDPSLLDAIASAARDQQRPQPYPRHPQVS